METSLNALRSFSHCAEYSQEVAITQSALVDIARTDASREYLRFNVDLRKSLPLRALHRLPLSGFVVLIGQRYHLRWEISIRPRSPSDQDFINKIDSFLLKFSNLILPYVIIISLHDRSLPVSPDIIKISFIIKITLGL